MATVFGKSLVGQALKSHPSYCVFSRLVSRAKRIRKKQERAGTVFQFAADKERPVKRLYVWGTTTTGALGIKTYVKPEKGCGHVNPLHICHHPVRLGFLDKNRYAPEQVACGYGFTLIAARKSNRELIVLGTGINTESQIGYHESPPRSGRILDYVIQPAPIDLPLTNPKTFSISSMSCGRAHTILATNEGIFTLGNNAYGQCGRSIIEDENYSKNPNINTMKFNEDIKQVVCGQDHTLLLTSKGEVYSCGLGADGQTGLGHYDCESQPTKVEGDIKGENILSISCRSDTVLAVSEKGDVFGWGNSEYNQLTMVTEHTQVNTPKHLPLKIPGKIVKTATSGTVCAALNDAGQVYVWGYGILGKGPNLESAMVPEEIPETLFGKNEFNPESCVVDIAAGQNYLGAITDSDVLYMWGRNESGCLGLGHKKDQYFPFQVNTPIGVKSISCGLDHSAAISQTLA